MGGVEVNEGPDLLTGLRSPGKNHFECGSQHIIGVCAQRPLLPLVRVGEREKG